jgi:acetylglutamate kinase
VSLVVLKCGGRVAAGTPAHVRALARAGVEVCVVHGAGPQITAEMELLGLEVRFVGGRRVTTAAGLAVVRRAMAAVNQEVCAAIGPRAVPLMGDAIGLPATHVPALGFVGEPVPSDPPAVRAALADGLVPVVAPLAAGPLNVNADDAAAALAVGLRADRIVFVSDVAGVLVGGEPLPTLGADEADELLEAGRFEGGIVPKLEAAVRAARLGVRAEIGGTAVLP